MCNACYIHSLISFTCYTILSVLLFAATKHSSHCTCTRTIGDEHLECSDCCGWRIIVVRLRWRLEINIVLSIWRAIIRPDRFCFRRFKHGLYISYIYYSCRHVIQRRTDKIAHPFLPSAGCRVTSLSLAVGRMACDSLAIVDGFVERQDGCTGTRLRFSGRLFEGLVIVSVHVFAD